MRMMLWISSIHYIREINMSYTKDTYYKENHNRMIDMTHHLYKVITDKEPSNDKIELLNNILREYIKLNEIQKTSVQYYEDKKDTERRFNDLSRTY